MLEERRKRADVIIPVYRPDEKLKKLLEGLRKQTHLAEHIFLIHTKTEGVSLEWCKEYETVQVIEIRPEEFDHGGTRRMGAELSDEEFLIFMTQDAVPQDQYLIEKLMEPFQDQKVGASYARQLPDKDCRMVECYTRSFNYPQEELVKIANGLEITVLEETVPYPSEAEIAEERQNDKDAAKKAEAEQEYRSSNGVSEELVYQVGEEVKDTTREMMAEADPDYLNEVEDIRFTVLSAEVSDTLPADTFSQQYFTTDMESWMNEDTSLKAHQRYRLGEEEGQTTLDALADKEAETVNAKYVIVKMKVKNASAFQTEWNKTEGVSIAPTLTAMHTGEEGKLVYPQETFWSANEGYDLQWGAERGGSFPIYFDKPYFTEGIKGVKSRLFCPLAPGEEMEYTLVYVVDEDQLSNMYLHFYPQNEMEMNGEYLTTPYVDISQ